MKIYSDILTTADLHATLRATVPLGNIDELHEIKHPRTRKHGWIVYCESLRDHGRARNGRPGKAMSYDEYGWWMLEMFRHDPAAIIANYNGIADFHVQTRNRFREDN